MIFAGVLGYVLITCWIFQEEIFFGKSSIGPEDSRNMFFNNNPKYLVWISSIVIQPVIWAVLLFPVTAIIIKLKEELKPEMNLLPSFILLLTSFVIFILITYLTFEKYFVRPESMIVDHLLKFRTITTIGQIVGLYYLFGAVLISKVCMKNISDKNYSISNYRRLRSYLDAIINFTGIIFSLGVIASILQSKALNDENKFPAEFIISFGMMNSLIILLVFLPAHFILLYYGRQILENKYTIKDSNSEAEIELLNKQNEVSKNLNLSLGLTQTFKTALVILSPVISSLIPKLFDI